MHPDNVDQLGLEVRIGGQLERVDPPRTQLTRLPHLSTVCLPTPCRAASDRVVQHVEPSSGTMCNVPATIASIVADAMSGVRARQSRITPIPATPSLKNRSPRRVTVFGSPSAPPLNAPRRRQRDATISPTDH